MTFDITNMEPKMCLTGDYSGWRDMFYCISPLTWNGLGVGIAMGFSVAGSAW